MTSGASPDIGSAMALMNEGSVAAKLLATAAEDGQLASEAGDGGDGGDIIISATGTVRLQPPTSGEPIFVLGKGGNGGDATSLVDGSVEGISAMTAVCGGGGEPGRFIFSAAGIEGLTYDEIEFDEPTDIGGVTVNVLWHLTGDCDVQHSDTDRKWIRRRNKLGGNH